MKLYRVVENPFSIDKRISNEKSPYNEALYYTLGYLNYKNTERKRFYLFKEDAKRIEIPSIRNNHSIETFFELEYDIPSYLVLMDIKQIEYSYKTLVVEKSLHNPTVKPLYTYKISAKEKQKKLLELFKLTIEKAIKEKNKDYLWYLNYCINHYESFSYLSKEDNSLQRVLKRSKFKLLEEGLLYRSNFITGNLEIINDSIINNSEENWCREELLKYTDRENMNKMKVLEFLSKRE